MVSAVAGVIFVGIGAGVLWIFIYGDNTWPGAAEQLLLAIAVLVAVLSFSMLVAATYFYGKRQESSGGISKWHGAVALAITILLPALILLRR